MESLNIITPIEQQVKNLEQEIKTKKEELAKLRRKAEAKPVDNYAFHNLDGEAINLKGLFGSKDELLLIFNMGKSCRYCTLWADGFNGLTDHLENRSAFALLTPDKPDIAKEFTTARNWQFRVISDYETSIREDLGLRDEKGVWPAAAVFTKDNDGNIALRSSSLFGPGDNFCPMWDLMDLFPSGYNEWQPQYAY